MSLFLIMLSVIVLIAQLVDASHNFDENAGTRQMLYIIVILALSTGAILT